MKKAKMMSLVVIAVLAVNIMLPMTAMADGETVTYNNYVYTVIDSGTALQLDSYLSTPTGSVTLPDSVDTGGYGYGTLPVTKIAGAVFRNCTDVLDVTLPSGLVNIGDNAFQGCGLYAISFPGTLKTIGYYAFDGCTHLQNVTFPGSLQSIGGAAFNGCTSSAFTSVTIPDSVSGMGDSAFQGCTHLVSAVLPDNAGFTAIPDWLFKDCSSLSSVTIPGSVTSIGNYSFAFTGFSTFEIPKNVTSINTTAFSGSSNLAGFTVEAGSASFIANDGALYSADNAQLVLISFAKTSLNVPEGVTEIGEHACDGCWHLHQLTLPSTLTKIDDYAFNNTGIASVTIPEGVTSIGFFGFTNCSQLTRVVFYTDTVTFTSDHIFSSNNTFYGHAGSTAQTYAAAHSIPFTLLLELEVAPSDATIYTGDSVVITPNVDGGTWDFDSTYLSQNGNEFTGLKAGNMTVKYTAGWQSESVNVSIKAASAAKTTVTPGSLTLYVGGRAILTPAVPGGTWQWDPVYIDLHQSQVTVKALKAGNTVIHYTIGYATADIPVTILEGSLPQTGQDITPVYWLIALAGCALAAGGGVLLYRQIKNKRKKTDIF